MLTFDPPDLGEGLNAALTRLHDYVNGALEVDWDPFNADVFDPAKYADDCITPESELGLGLPRDELRQIAVARILELAQDIVGGKLDDAHQRFDSSVTLLYRVEPVSEHAFKYAYFTSSEECSLHYVVETAVDGKPVRCSLRRGITAYAVEIVKQSAYDKYNPPVVGDLLVEVRGPGLSSGDRLSCLWAYLFELNASAGITLKPAGRFWSNDDLEYDLEDEDEVVEAARVARMRPLLTGPGLPGVLEAYAKAVTVEEPDLRVLALVRALEWVAVTVVRSKGNEEVRRRLLAPEALSPDPRFIADLFEFVEAHRTYKTDGEALRLTVETCCDAVALAPIAPPVVGKLAKITESSNAAEKREALAQLAKVLVATRNMIAHAKPNYRPTSDECPWDQLRPLAACVEVAVQQAIRWYSYSDTTLRML